MVQTYGRPPVLTLVGSFSVVAKSDPEAASAVEDEMVTLIRDFERMLRARGYSVGRDGPPPAFRAPVEIRRELVAAHDERLIQDAGISEAQAES